MTVGIINVPFVEQQLMNYAKQQNNAMLGVVTYATAYTLATSAKNVKFLRGKMEDAGCPKGTIDVCFAIAKVVAPSIEDAVKTAATPEAALAQIQAQIVAKKADLSWKDFKAKLQGKGTQEQLPPIAVDTAPGLVTFVAPPEPAELVKAPVVLDAVPAPQEPDIDAFLESLEDYGAVFEGIVARCGPEAWAAMAERLVELTEEHAALAA